MKNSPFFLDGSEVFRVAGYDVIRLALSYQRNQEIIFGVGRIISDSSRNNLDPAGAQKQDSCCNISGLHFFAVGNFSDLFYQRFGIKNLVLAFEQFHQGVGGGTTRVEKGSYIKAGTEHQFHTDLLFFRLDRYAFTALLASSIACSSVRS